MPGLNWTRARDDGRMRRQGRQVHEDLLPRVPQDTGRATANKPRENSTGLKRFTTEQDVVDHLIRQLLRGEKKPRLNRNMDPRLEKQIREMKSPYEWVKKHPEFKSRYQKISRQHEGNPQLTEEEKLELVLTRLNMEKGQLIVKIENLNKELEQLNEQIKNLSDTK